MRHNQLICLLVLLVMLSFTTNAQGVLTSPGGSTLRTIKRVSVLDALNAPVEQTIKGSPYLTDTYTKGNIFLQTGGPYVAEMRFNIFYDQLEFKERDSVFSIGPDPLVRKIVIGPQTLVVDKIVFKGETLPTYYSRLDSGKLTLLTKMLVSFKDSETKPIEGFVPAQYERVKDEYYFKISNGVPQKVRSITKLIEELPDHKPEMEAYAKKEKISTNNLKELRKFIEYYNSMGN